ILGKLGTLGLDHLSRDVLDVDVARVRPGDLDRQVADDLLDLLIAGHEVTVPVDLDQDADPAAGVDVAPDQALPRFLPGPLGRRSLAALAKPRDRLLHVAVALLDGAFAIHEGGLRDFAQLLDLRRRDFGHVRPLLLLTPVPPNLTRLPGSGSPG